MDEIVEETSTRISLTAELIEEWKNESDIENILETLKEVNAFLVHKYGSPKFPKFSVEILKVRCFSLFDSGSESVKRKHNFILALTTIVLLLHI